MIDPIIELGNGIGPNIIFFSLFLHVLPWHRSSNKEDAAFDEIIGHIQDILIGMKSRSSKFFFSHFFVLD